jgi:uncharacterized damage-inducible protein DinB
VEAQATRRVLERLPDDKMSWRAHPTSMSLGQLGLHVASTPFGVAQMAGADSMEVPTFQQAEASSKSEILAAHDQAVAAFKTALQSWDDAKMQAVWSLTRDGQAVMQVPRMALIRSVGMNHVYHHRGQLTLCLRMLGVPVPAVYGVSRDENPFA